MNGITLPKPHCGVAMGLVVVLFLLLGAMTVWPWWDRNQDYQDRIQGQADKLGRFKALISQKPRFKQALNQVEKEQRASSYYIEASSASLAGAQLQKRAKQVIEANEGKLVSTQILPAKVEGSAQRIGIRVRMSGDTPMLLQVLYGLEEGRPLIFVENLSVRSRRSTRRSRRNVKAKIVREVTINFDLYGYLKEPAG